MDVTGGSSGWAGTRERIERLRAADPSLRVHGATGHGFRLAPVLSESQVVEAERALGVRFPEEYRTFLTEVGSGGAGPGYGMPVLRRGADGWSWEGDVSGETMLDRLHLPAPSVEELDALEAEEERTVPKAEDFPTVEEYAAARQAWKHAADEVYESPCQGSLPLGHQGCGWCEWLVVSGPLRGTVRAIGDEVLPVAPDFRTRYLAWLERAEGNAGLPGPAHG